MQQQLHQLNAGKNMLFKKQNTSSLCNALSQREVGHDITQQVANMRVNQVEAPQVKRNLKVKPHPASALNSQSQRFFQ